MYHIDVPPGIPRITEWEITLFKKVLIFNITMAHLPEGIKHGLKFTFQSNDLLKLDRLVRLEPSFRDSFCVASYYTCGIPLSIWSMSLEFSSF